MRGEALLSRLERAIEDVVEGSINTVFRLRVQPAEIGRKLERVLLEQRVTSTGKTLGPNAFDVALHPDDAAAYAAWSQALGREMELWLTEVAYARGIATVGSMRVRISADDNVRRRSVRVTGQFDAAQIPDTAPVATKPGATVIARLVPDDGRFKSARITGSAVTVGRSSDNVLVIDLPQISRYHARLETSNGAFLLSDRESTNGTWVNGQRITRTSVTIGDQISFATVRYTLKSA